MRDHQLWVHLVQLGPNGYPQGRTTTPAGVRLTGDHIGEAWVEFRQDLLLVWSDWEGRLHVLDLQLRPLWQLRLCMPFDCTSSVVFLGQDTMVVDGWLVCSWRREPGRLLRRLDYSPLARLHAENPRKPSFSRLDEAVCR